MLNLSLQTDSTDLLGGYKPLEIRHVARGVYDAFVDLFVSSFSRSQNAQFLRFVLNAFEKGDWKKLAQCFIKAAGMGEKKVSAFSCFMESKDFYLMCRISCVGTPRIRF